MGNFNSELKNYECIPRELVFDTGLTDRARFVYVYMACKPAEWDFFLEPMAAELGYSVDTLHKYLDELIRFGWLVKGEQKNEQGRFGSVSYTLKAKREIPTRKNPMTENTDTENFRLGKNTPLKEKEEKEKRNINRKDITQDTTVSHEAESTLSPQSETIEWGHFLSFFNSLMSTKAIKPISKITEKRKSAVRARLREFGKDAIATVIRKAAASDFLNGKNNRCWTADFEWLFRPNNFPKVLEGNYDNRDNNTQQEYHTNNGRETITDRMRSTLEEAEEFDRKLTAQREAAMDKGDIEQIW